MQKVGSTAAIERGPQWATEEQTSLVLLPSSWSNSTHRRRQEGSLPTREDGQKLVVNQYEAGGREASLALPEKCMRSLQPTELASQRLGCT